MLQELKYETDKEISGLRSRVSSQAAMLEELRYQKREMEVMHLASSQVYEQEVHNLKTKLAVTDTQRQQAVLTRDRY